MPARKEEKKKRKRKEMAVGNCLQVLVHFSFVCYSKKHLRTKKYFSIFIFYQIKKVTHIHASFTYKRLFEARAFRTIQSVLSVSVYRTPIAEPWRQECHSPSLPPSVRAVSAETSTCPQNAAPLPMISSSSPRRLTDTTPICFYP